MPFVMAISSRPLVPSRLRPGGGGHGVRSRPHSLVGAYIALTKPRIIELLLITTIPTMILAEQGLPRVSLILTTLVGGSLAAGGANAINMYIDRDIDRLMPRTQGRPLVTGAMTPTAALVFALVLEVVAFVELWVLVNPLSAVLTLSASVFYVFVYTIWLKRTSKQNIVIGGAAGAVPVLVGWTAVTDRLSWAPVVLFVVMFLWTPPHFWALAIRYRDDYAAADVPMLPVVETLKVTSERILAYTVVLWAMTIVVVPVAHTGLLYAATAFVLGALFVWFGNELRRAPTPANAMRLFGFSITYATLLFVALAADTLVRHGF
jgi:protoheme IX farnesyltransferase